MPALAIVAVKHPDPAMMASVAQNGMSSYLDLSGCPSGR